jgi:hypothetical protein
MMMYTIEFGQIKLELEHEKEKTTNSTEGPFGGRVREGEQKYRILI